MIESIEAFDRSIIVAINNWNSPLMDEVMWVISGKLTWIPLFFLLLFLGYRKLDRKSFIWMIIGSITAIALADLASVHLFKEVVQRYRPSHNLLIHDQLHFYEMKPGELYKGGLYGFVSSHAANFFALGVYFSLVLRPYYKWITPFLLGIACLIGYSRMYLGVHYLTDIFGGASLGMLVAILVYKFGFLKLSAK